MKSSLKIGRDNTNDIVINEPRISRNHATITLLAAGEYEVKDLGSSNGTFINGIKIVKQIIYPGDRLQVATSLVDWENAFAGSANAAKSDSGIHENAYGNIKKTIKVGSADDNDIVIKNEFVSGHHSKISVLSNGDYFLQDLGSRNGTFVNGVKVLAKNFKKTDTVKVARTDLPNDWVSHKKLQTNFYRDHKKAFWIVLILLLITGASVIIYTKRCLWFGWGCNLSVTEMYSQNHKALVHVTHQYYYTIQANDITYYVGKNKSFSSQTEANTSNANLLPYSTVSGMGCFIKSDGSILTAPAITNPWLNEAEQAAMLEEVIVSKTIPGLKRGSNTVICGETAYFKWIPGNVINNQQNFTEARGTKDCRLNDSTPVLIQSVKKRLPENAIVATYYYDTAAQTHMHHTAEKYYGSLVLPESNALMKDTFLMATDSFNINKGNSMPLIDSLRHLKEGTPVFNKRGELIGIISNSRVTYLNVFYNQLIQ